MIGDDRPMHHRTDLVRVETRIDRHGGGQQETAAEITTTKTPPRFRSSSTPARMRMPVAATMPNTTTPAPSTACGTEAATKAVSGSEDDRVQGPV